MQEDLDGLSTTGSIGGGGTIDGLGGLGTKGVGGSLALPLVSGYTW